MAEESSSNVRVTNCCDDCFYCISLLTLQYKTSLWNVNIPNCTVEELKGFKVTDQGSQYFEDDFDSRKDPKGNKYFWMIGEMIDNDKNFKSDSFAVKNNYVSITPIGYHLSKLSEIQKIEDIL